jgi:hypothetical protein
VSAETDDEKELMEGLRRSISAGEAEELAARVYDLDTLLIKTGEFSAAVFEGLLDILAEPRFLGMDGSWHLLRLFENSWDYLTEGQRDRLLDAFEASYGEYADWTSCFVISEILGRQYGDERALQSFRRLKKLRAPVPRSLLPHGLEHLVKGRQGDDVARRAFAELSGMSKDPSEQVREEVSAALARLARKGHK